MILLPGMTACPAAVSVATGPAGTLVGGCTEHVRLRVEERGLLAQGPTHVAGRGDHEAGGDGCTRSAWPGTSTSRSYCGYGAVGTLTGRCGVSSKPDTAIQPMVVRLVAPGRVVGPDGPQRGVGGVEDMR